MITYADKNNEYEGLTSRYKIYRVINDHSDDSVYIESFNQTKSNWDNETGNFYHTVTKQEEGRLDLISYNMYGTQIYWWAIALVNQIIDPFDIPKDSLLIIPSLASLYDRSNHVL